MNRDKMCERSEALEDLRNTILCAIEVAEEVGRHDLVDLFSDVAFDVKTERDSLEKEISAIDQKDEALLYAESMRW